MIYLNNAATSYPKPASVVQAVKSHFLHKHCEPGRGSDGNNKDVLTECRAKIGSIFNIKEITRIILTSGSTSALNYAIQGLIHAHNKAHCITSTMEHNSVLRPLNHLVKNQNLTVTHLSSQQIFNIEKFEETINNSTKFVILNHVSNVTGTISPIKEIAKKCAAKKIPLIIDASQSAGSLEINIQDFPGNIILIFTGHKGLMGPMGTGGFYIGSDIELFEPVIQGGTGIRSDLMFQPKELPMYYEAGTMNLPGFAGLAAGVEFVKKVGVKNVGQHKHRLFSMLKELLIKNDKLTLYEPLYKNYSSGVISFNINGWNPADVGIALQESFGIISRTGLHCAPLIHKEVGSWPVGSVRLSCSWCTTREEIEKTARAVNTILKSK